jgi:hypothetical protein
MSIPKLVRFCLVAAVGSFSIYSLQVGSSVAISGESKETGNSLAIEQDFLVLNQMDCPSTGSVSGHSDIDAGEVLHDWQFTDGLRPRPPKCRGFRR